MPAALPFVTQALPYVSAAATIYSALRPQPQVQLPPPPPTLTYEEARRQSQDILNPVYDEQLRNTLRQVDLHNMRRGFYGQLPGDALSRTAAADIETRRAQNIGQLAVQMQGMSHEQALQHAQLALQQAQMAAQNNPWTRLAQATSALSGVQNLWPTAWSNFFGGNIGNPLQTAQQVLQSGWVQPALQQPVESVPATTPARSVPAIGGATGSITGFLNPY